MARSKQHRHLPRTIRVLTLATLCAAILGVAGRAQTFTVLHTFTGGADGGGPIVGLTIDAAGNLYGTTTSGGPGGYGTVFKMTRRGSGWEFSTLYSFHGADGEEPESRVIFGPDGTLYGTTNMGGGDGCGYLDGCGVVFRLRPPASACKTAICYWTENVIYGDFGFNANFPFGDIAFDQQGNLYGIAGDIYQLMPSNGSWTLNVINQTVGSYNGVTFDASGNLYGAEDNLIWRLVPSDGQWIEQDLYNTNNQTQGEGIGGLAFDQAGNIYAGSTTGGPNGGGTAFELTQSDGSWVFNLLHAFSGNGGPYNGKLLLDAAGNVYGTALSDGTGNEGPAFKLTPSNGGWSYTDLHGFHGPDGCYPNNSMVMDASGNVYGTTEGCGMGNPAYGVVFEITP